MSIKQTLKLDQIWALPRVPYSVAEPFFYEFRDKSNKCIKEIVNDVMGYNVSDVPGVDNKPPRDLSIAMMLENICYHSVDKFHPIACGALTYHVLEKIIPVPKISPEIIESANRDYNMEYESFSNMFDKLIDYDVYMAGLIDFFSLKGEDKWSASFAGLLTYFIINNQFEKDRLKRGLIVPAGIPVEEELKIKLEGAVRTENYELAAALRDEIKSLTYKSDRTGQLILPI